MLPLQPDSLERMDMSQIEHTNEEARVRDTVYSSTFKIELERLAQLARLGDLLERFIKKYENS